MGELTPASAGPLRVLLVDDDAEMRAIGRMGLALDGRMDVVVAGSGEEGAELARVERPDVILLDALMPGLDGLGTVKVLRQHEFTAETPIIFLTATSEPDELRRLRDADVAGIIAKPFSPKSLAPLVRGLLEKFLASRNPVPGNAFSSSRTTTSWRTFWLRCCGNGSST